MATVGMFQRTTGRHRSFYYDCFARMKNIDAVVIVDPDGGTFKEAKAAMPEMDVRTYTDLDQATRKEKMAMAVVTFTAAESPAWIERTLKADLPCIIEKPACLEVGDFARLVELADTRKLPMMMALCNRLMPIVEEARRIYQQGGIGRLYAARVLALADQSRIWQERTRDWTFNKAEAAGGHLIFLGIHWIDALLFITGAKAREVQALTNNVGGGPIDVEDVATVNVRFTDGSQASILTGYVLDTSKQLDLSLWGADGWIRLDYQTSKMEWHGTSPAMHRSNDRQFAYAPAGGGYHDYWPFIESSLAAAEGKGPPPITGAEELEVLKVIFAAYRSADTGQTVTI